MEDLSKKEECCKIIVTCTYNLKAFLVDPEFGQKSDPDPDQMTWIQTK